MMIESYMMVNTYVSSVPHCPLTSKTGFVDDSPIDLDAVIDEEPEDVVFHWNWLWLHGQNWPLWHVKCTVCSLLSCKMNKLTFVIA
jgi:hypothetical protein